MRNARVLRAEADLWRLAWQGVETFLDRIEGADGQDAPHRRRLHALLLAARTAEHQRTVRFDAKPLCDPVIDGLPVTPPATAWGLDHRKWRIPGTDEVELAVGSLFVEDPGDDPDPVRLLPPVELFAVRVDPSDPRAAEASDGLITLRLPSYPGTAAGGTILGAPLPPGAPIGLAALQADIAEPGGAETSSLFSRERRRQAATDIDHEVSRLRNWSELCRDRRAGRAAAADDEVKGCGPGAGEPLPWGPAQDALARAVIRQVLIGQAFPDGSSAADHLVPVEAAARAAAARGGRDGADLRAAAEALEEEGVEQEGLLATLGNAAAATGGQPALFLDVAVSAAALASAVRSPPLGVPVGAALAAERARLAGALAGALDRLAPALAPQPLFLAALEDGPLAAETDRAVAARIRYPDGTLRVLRALETAFLLSWPARLAWFRDRHALALRPAMRRFRQPFLAGLRALLRGGETGLPVGGLTLGAQAPVGAQTLATGQYASILPALSGIEAGHVGVLARDRPAAAVILGVGATAGRVELNVAPLRISIAASSSGVPGAPGVAAAGQEILSRVAGPGFSAAELRAGAPAAGAAASGLMEQALGLWSRLSLVFGRARIDEELRGAAQGPPPVPDPSDAPLHALALSGQVPRLSMTLVIAGAGEGWWRREGDPAGAVPRLARAGELLLLRGRGEAEGQAGGTGPMLQAVAEVDSVFRTTGAMLRRMDTGNAALLSARPGAAAPDPRDCALLCGPEEDVMVVILRRSWQRKALTGEVTLRRDFAGFDAASLAAERLLPTAVLDRILAPEERVADGGVARDEEFKAALETLADWLRYAAR